MGIVKNMWILYKNGNRVDCPAIGSEIKARKMLANIANFARELEHGVEFVEGPALSGDFGLTEITPQGKVEYLMKCTLAV